MTKIVKNFNKFSKVYESEMNADLSAEIINKAKEEMPLEVVADDAAQLVDPNKSDISDKMNQAAQAQAQPEPQVPSTLKESVYSGTDLIDPIVMDDIMKSAITRLPALIPDSEVYQRGRGVLVPEGSHFLADSFASGDYGYTITYKDKNAKYQDVYLSFRGEKEDIEHLKSIFEDLAKKSKWKNFVDKTVSIAGPTLIAVGFGLFIFGMIRFNMSVSGNDSWLAGGGGGYSRSSFSWDKVAPIGGYEAATGGGLFVAGATLATLTGVTEGQVRAIDGGISKLAAVLKAYLIPLGMKLTDLKTAADINAVLSTDINNSAEAVSVETTKMSGDVRESKSTKFGNFKRF